MSPAKEPFYLAHYSVIPWGKETPQNESDEDWEPLYSDTDSAPDAEDEALLTDDDDDEDYNNDAYYEDEEDESDYDEVDALDSMTEDEASPLTDNFDIEELGLTDEEASLLDNFQRSLDNDSREMSLSNVFAESQTMSDTSTRIEPPMGLFRYRRLRAASLGAIKFSESHPESLEDCEISSVD